VSVVNHAPRFSLTSAKKLASDFFGLEGGLELLPSERDQNFLVRGPHARHVLKIANAL